MKSNARQETNSTFFQSHRCTRYWCSLFILMTLLTVGVMSGSQAQMMETTVPADSFFYLQLQNLQACQEEIRNSENWKQTTKIISTLSKWQPMHQFIEMLPTFLGTDIQGLIEVFLADRLAVTVSPGPEGLMVGIVIENKENQHQEAERIFAHFLQTVAEIAGNQTQLVESEYRNIKYSTAKINERQLTYGYLNKTLFLIGITPGSLKKMVDVYKNERDSIVSHSTYRAVSDKFGKNEVFAFVDMHTATPFVKSLLPPLIASELEAFRTLVYSWELLRQGGNQWVYGQLTENYQEGLIPLTPANTNMAITYGLTGQESVFLAVAPSITTRIWQSILGSQLDMRTPTEESVLSFLIPKQADILAAGTGELAISIADLVHLSTLSENLYSLHVLNSNGVIEDVELDFPAADLGIVFKPNSPMEWEILSNGILENLTSHPRQQFEYKGVIFNMASLPGKLYYGNVKGFFVFAFSEKHVKSIFDNILTTEDNPLLKRRLEQLPIPPISLLQVNLDDYLSIIATEEEVTMFPKKIGTLQSSLTVQAGEVWLELTISPQEKPIDAIALLAPMLFLEALDLPFAQ